MAGEIPDMRSGDQLPRNTPSLLTKSFVDADLNDVLSCFSMLQCKSNFLPGASCPYLFTSMEILLIEIYDFAGFDITRIMLLCLPIISTMSLLDVVKLGLHPELEFISMIRPESCCLIAVMRPLECAFALMTC